MIFAYTPKIAVKGLLEVSEGNYTTPYWNAKKGHLKRSQRHSAKNRKFKVSNVEMLKDIVERRYHSSNALI